MAPEFLLLSLGGHLLILAGFVWLLYRLGGFVATPQERRTWTILAGLAVPWAVLLAFIGPLPVPIVLAGNFVVILLYIWAWRTGRYRLDHVPVDVREQVAQRRQWMRSHRGVLIALMTGAIVATLVWASVVVLFLAP